MILVGIVVPGTSVRRVRVRAGASLPEAATRRLLVYRNGLGQSPPRVAGRGAYGQGCARARWGGSAQPARCRRASFSVSIVGNLPGITYLCCGDIYADNRQSCKQTMEDAIPEKAWRPFLLDGRVLYPQDPQSYLQSNVYNKNDPCRHSCTRSKCQTRSRARPLARTQRKKGICEGSLASLSTLGDSPTGP